jgi:CheY-like chemotaxis protein
MSGMDGIELQRRLIARGTACRSSLSAFPEAKVRAQALAAGALGFLSKPFSDEKLIMYLDQAWKRAAPDTTGNFNRGVATRSRALGGISAHRETTATVLRRRAACAWALAHARAGRAVSSSARLAMR